MSVLVKKVGVSSLCPKRVCNLVVAWWNIVLDRYYEFVFKSGSARGRKILVAKVESFSYDFRELGDFLDPVLGFPLQIITNRSYMDKMLPHLPRSYQKSFSLFASRCVLYIQETFASFFCMDFRDLLRFQNHPT